MNPFPILFSPVRIAGTELKNRIVMPAMATNFLTDGTVTERMIDYFRVRARGGAGLLVTEAASVRAVPGSHLSRLHLNVSDDRFLPPLKALVDAVHREGGRIAVQLSHLGRQVASAFSGAVPVAPSPVPCPVTREVPKELSAGEIGEIVRDFVRGAVRAREAGFDAVELHACHGYLIGQFFSPLSNRRTDRYGGDAEGRSRFAVEIIRGIREALGTSFPVIARINGEDGVPGGPVVEDMLEIVPFLVGAGADALHVSAGVYGSARATVAPMFEERGCYVPLAARVRKEVSVPVIAVGRIDGPALAEEILRSGKADMVAMGRALLADPDLPVKAASGREGEILSCLGCNQGCIDRINASMMTGRTEGITCLVNPGAGREREAAFGKAPRRKRVLVAGGGPGGLEAALTAAGRGHEVALWEKENVLGGQLRLTGRVPGRDAFLRYVEFMEAALGRAGVSVVLNRAATGERVRAEGPDAVIVATGAVPAVPPFVRGGLTAWEVLRGAVPAGEEIVVLGGGAVGLETAHFLADLGKRVTVLEMTGRFGGDMGAISAFYVRRFLLEKKVRLERLAVVQEATDREVRYLREGEEKTLSGFDALVIALGACSDRSLAGELESFGGTLVVVGDALAPRKALEAVFEGFEAGRTL
jgi:2,4-dienoyl-CoA reductase-like NADH-dependent reductase (Old Yellow Enzyme family)/thioredoxin reductase